MIPNKRCRVEFRLSKTERERLSALASEAGLNVSDYLRYVAIRGEVPPVITDVAIRTYWELGKVGSNLNQVARSLNQAQQNGQSIEIPTQAIADLQNLLQQIRLEIAGIKRANQEG